MGLRQFADLVGVAACDISVQIHSPETYRIPVAFGAISPKRVPLLPPALSPEQLAPAGNNVTKDELRAELERQEQRYKEVYGGEITTYAAQPEPERKPWRKRASLLDQAFKQELQKMEEELKEER